MSNFVSVIKECESASGAGSKKMIQEALKKLDKNGQRLVREALDPYRVFGVKKFEMPAEFASSSSSQAYEFFFNVLDQLHLRNLTGNAARAAVTEALSKFPKEESNYLSRVIGKDLKAGFSADTFNKIFKNSIPEFSVMLAEKFDSDEEVKTLVKFPCLAEAKYDGERTVAIVTENEVAYYSRSGKRAAHVDGLFDEDLLKMRQLFGEDIVVDGERYASNFTETMNSKKSGNDLAKSNLRLYAFFVMSLSDWKAQTCSHSMLENRQLLKQLIEKAETKKVHLSRGVIVDSPASAEAFYKEMVNEGFEGLILKQSDCLYEWDRSKNWIKWKPFFDFDGVVIDTYTGREGTRLSDLLGGITIEGYDELGRHVITNVGSGFSDEDRKKPHEFWLGKTVTVKYQEISKSPNSDTYSLRFPTFERIRDDK